jgi:lysophospholipase L1-like esterase
LYSETTIAIGKEVNVPVIDAWTLTEGNTNNRAAYFTDGLHLNAKYVCFFPL